MPHGRYQNRQLVPLRLALPRQPLGQLRLNPFRPNRDPVDLCHRSIPCRKPHGIGASHSFSPSTYHHGKLMDGEVGGLSPLYFGIRNDMGPPLHMPSERISSCQKLLPSLRMVSASGFISALSPTFGGLHGWGVTSFNFRSAKTFGVTISSGEDIPSHSAILHTASSELSSS